MSDFDYNLPEERIAKFPPKERGATRLCVLDKKTGAVKDAYYRELDEFLRAGDVVILNDTKVMQSRLFCELADGRPRELVVLEKHGEEPQRVMYRGKLHEGDVLRVLKAGFSGMENSSAKRTEELKGLEKTPYEVEVVTLLGDGLAEVVVRGEEVELAELAERYGSVGAEDGECGGADGFAEYDRGADCAAEGEGGEGGVSDAARGAGDVFADTGGRGGGTQDALGVV